MSNLVKPARWAWNRALLAPEWRQITRGLTRLWHTEASAGRLGLGATGSPLPAVRDVVTWEAASFTSGANSQLFGVYSGIGMAFDYDNDDYHDLGYDPNFGTGDWSCLLYWIPTRETAASPPAWTFGSIAEKGTHDPTFGIFSAWVSGTDYQPGYFLRDGSGNVPGASGNQAFGPILSEAPNAISPTADDFWCAVFSKKGSDITVTLDGEVLRTHGGLTGSFDFSSYPFYQGKVNARGVYAGEKATAHALAAFWDRALTDAEAVKLTRTPFGLLTPERIAVHAAVVPPDETGKVHALTATAEVTDVYTGGGTNYDETGKTHALTATAAVSDTQAASDTGKSHALTATAAVTDVYTAAGLLTIDWDNLADEADIGNTGGQGDPWEFGFTNGTTTVKANANTIDYGTDPSLTNTMRVSVVSGAAAARGWDASIGTTTDIAFLVPVILTSLPGATEEVEPIRFRTNTNAVNAVVQIEGNGDVQIRRLAGTLVDSTGAGAVSAGDTIWLQGLFNFDNSGSLELNIYDDTGTLIDTLSGTGIDTFNGAATDNVQVGAGTTDAAGNFTIEFGRVKLETGASAHIAMPSFPTTYDETGKTHALTATATSSDSASFSDSAAHALTATAEVADTSAMADSVSHALSATAVVTDVFSGTFIETGKTHALTATAQVTDVLASSTVSQTFQMLWSVEGATLPTTPDLDTLTPPAVQGPTHVPKATPR